MKRLHKHKIDTPEWYERVWSEKWEAYEYDHERILALIDNVLPGESLLDVGAGIMGCAQYIAEHGLRQGKVDLFAVDYSHTARDLVCGKFPQIKWGHFDFDDDGVPCVMSLVTLKGFDRVVAGEVIEHVENPIEFCAGCCRACKPGGTVTISTVDTKSKAAIKHGEYLEHIWEFTPDDLVSFFVRWGNPQYYLVGNYHFVRCTVDE